MKATARAGANIALVKYWGKRDELLKLPRNGSISLTLAGLEATTTVEFLDAGAGDRFVLDGRPRSGRELERVSALLDLVRERAGLAGRPARVESRTTVPVAAGLASSAAGFAALAGAAAWAAGLDLPARELSILARRGSGSACRSVLGGFVEWRRGERPDGADSHAERLLEPGDWDLRMVICEVAGAGAKAVSSSEAMARSTRAPAYVHWESTVEADLETCRRGVLDRDLTLVGLVAESSAVKMHMTAAAAEPPIVYWSDATVKLVRKVPRLRQEEGLAAWYTIDAGPHVAVLTTVADAAEVARKLGEGEGVARVAVCAPGPGATRLETALF